MSKLNKLYLFRLCGVAALGGFLFGFDTAVISGTITMVKSRFAMDAIMEGWFVSCALLGCIIGVSFAGKMGDSYGRKRVLMLSGLLFMFSAMGCVFPTHEGVLILFRFLGGVGVGVASILAPLYISELSPAHLRGRMVSLYQLAITLGILIAYFCNAWLQSSATDWGFTSSFLQWILVDEVWRAMFGMEIIPALVFVVFLFFIPESPRWLVVRGRSQEAVTLMDRIWGKGNGKDELDMVQRASEQEPVSIKQLWQSGYRLALILGVLLAITQQASGINAVIYYGPRILEQAGFALGDALGGQVSIGVVNVLFTLVAIFSIDRWGRRPLLMFGVGGAVLSLVGIGVLFALEMTSGPWLLGLILLFIACFAFSLGPVVWVIIGEIYPNAIRGRAMGLATLAVWVANFFVGQLTPVMLNGIGPSYTFWIFALLCAPAFFIAWKVLPETQGKTLEEIENFWEK